MGAPASWATYACRATGELSLAVFEAPRQNSRPAPSALFFHGGGWKGGQTSQFTWWARLLAARGFMVFCPQYRLLGSGANSVADCVADANESFAYVAEHAALWNLDPHRIIVGGGSAGGHLALMVAQQRATTSQSALQNAPQGATQLECGAICPAGCLLFNPVVDTSELFVAFPHLNPASLPCAGLPPLLFLQGEADTIVSLDSVRAYVEKAKAAGVDASVVTYPHQNHGFFNPGKAEPAVLDDLQRQIEKFSERFKR